MKVELTINGEKRSVDLPPMTRLIDALRGPLGLTGTKEGCGEGECGSCAVLLDGDPVNACLVLIGQCDGRDVLTTEGLAEDGKLAPLQQCMSDFGGAQCGICTPGMLIAAEALLRRNAEPEATDIRKAIGGNLCRCTGYERIVQSILAAAKQRSERQNTREAAE
ncbi:(2Fe-2S)-binding protein [Endomicrobium sp. AH-315-J14]|nr:(2Fe-2S)-binding protein [Endomicrobium sp. AH-315-J14]